MSALKSRPRILLADDDRDFCSDMKAVLAPDFQLTLAHTPADCLRAAAACRPDTILLDIDFQESRDGYWVLERLVTDKLGEAVPPPPVIMLTAERDPAAVVRAIQGGAFHFLAKPVAPGALVSLTSCACELERARRRNQALAAESDRAAAGCLFVDPRSRPILAQIERVATTDATVLITGETGSGKEVVANLIHQRSQRRREALVSLNCGEIPSGLIASELFGHVKGAFTDATHDRRGMFELASEGTIFLDEVGECPARLQQALLRVLETKRFRPVGGETERATDARVLTAASQDLDRLLDCGLFREDLYYRLDQYRIHIPPLRQRPADVEVLAEKFRLEMADAYGLEVAGFSAAAMRMLREHSWPGNVRELRNVISKAVIESRGRLIECGDLQLGRVRHTHFSLPYHEAKRRVVGDFQRQYFRDLLVATGGDVSATAQLAGVQRPACHKILKECGLEAERYRDAPRNHKHGDMAQTGGAAHASDGCLSADAEDAAPAP